MEKGKIGKCEVTAVVKIKIFCLMYLQNKMGEELYSWRFLAMVLLALELLFH